MQSILFRFLTAAFFLVAFYFFMRWLDSRLAFLVQDRLTQLIDKAVSGIY